MNGPAFSQRIPPVQNITTGLELGRQFLHGRREIAEVPDLRDDRSFERPHPHFVVVAGVEQRHRPTFVQPLLELACRDLRRRTPGRVDAFDAERDDLLLDLHEHALERLIGTGALLGSDVRQTGHGADDFQYRRQLRPRAGQKEIDALGRQQDGPLQAVRLGRLLQPRPQLLQPFQRGELITGEIDDLGGHGRTQG